MFQESALRSRSRGANQAQAALENASWPFLLLCPVSLLVRSSYIAPASNRRMSLEPLRRRRSRRSSALSWLAVFAWLPPLSSAQQCASAGSGSLYTELVNNRCCKVAPSSCATSAGTLDGSTLSNKVTCTYTSGTATLSLPTTATKLLVDVIGGNGGNSIGILNGGKGGAGSRISGNILSTSAYLSSGLYVIVGAGGESASGSAIAFTRPRGLTSAHAGAPGSLLAAAGGGEINL